MKAIFRRGVRILIQLLSIALLVCMDRWLKDLAVQYLRGSADRVLIPGVLGLSYAENTGAAFSLLSDSTAALSVATALLLSAGVVALIAVRRKALIYDICLPLIIAGGGGNLLDRVSRGYVVDYIQTLFMDFPIFNFADCLITCACFAVVIYLIVQIATDAKKRRMPPEDSYYAEGNADGAS